jgi:hypothetical protein
MRQFFPSVVIFVLLLTACNIPQPGQQPTVDPGRDLMGTVVAATFQAMTPLASPQVETPTAAATSTPAATATASTSKVSGKVCYHDKGMVQLTLYFQNTTDDKVLTQSVSRPNETYNIELLPGKYKIYGWPPDYTIGVLAENKPTIDVTLSHPIINLNFCDYSQGPFAAPYPPGVSPSKAAGSITGTISGYAGHDSLTVVAFNQGTGYWYYFILLVGQTDFAIPDLPAGRYQVVAYDKNGSSGGTEPNIYVIAGQKTIANISNWGGGYPANPVK